MCNGFESCKEGSLSFNLPARSDLVQHPPVARSKTAQLNFGCNHCLYQGINHQSDQAEDRRAQHDVAKDLPDEREADSEGSPAAIDVG